MGLLFFPALHLNSNLDGWRRPPVGMSKVKAAEADLRTFSSLKVKKKYITSYGRPCPSTW